MTDNARVETRDNQAAQQELLDQAKREPGIAEALAAYQAILPYLPPKPLEVRPQLRYATGGNG